MAAPSIAGTIEVNDGSSITVTKPAGGAAGDIYIVCCTVESGASPGLSLTGFTAIGAEAGNNGGGQASWSLTFWRVYDGTEGSTFGPVTGTGGDYTNLESLIIRGADTGTAPIVGAPYGGFTDPHGIGGLTTVTNDSLVIADFTAYFGLGSPVTPPSGFSLESVHSGNSSYIWSLVKTTAGAVGTATVTYGFDTAASGRMFAFAPSGGGGAPAGRPTIVVPPTALHRAANW